ncbi:hypothetical protein Agabi119p4_8 [Agaricus bisporus var. burnettii]|uniref:Aminoglycoside phosphotransferase domain-containing protein n=1 Tax=Agaricus bisporus var. burnettii TaxID=192524 RepID=A0A8H7FA62_AGABI|nr:hypothetical protein Agabi119p4_8 [Agaricus bisporus var. burnettii]
MMESYSDLEAYPLIYRGPCTTVVLVAPDIILKWYGGEEVHVLHFARRHLIPVPRVLYHRRRAPYFCMEQCRGVSLEKVIDTMSLSDLVHIANQLSSILTQMSSIKSRFICSVKNQALRNFFYPPSFEPKHPFSSVSEFYDYYRDMLRWCSTDEWLDSFFHRLPRNDAIHFVHGDLVPPNIMVEDSTITGIIDWASGGFYPSHWEYCRMWQYTSGNWVYILERVFPGRPRRMEIEAYRKLISMLANNF